MQNECWSSVRDNGSGPPRPSRFTGSRVPARPSGGYGNRKRKDFEGQGTRPNRRNRRSRASTKRGVDNGSVMAKRPLVSVGPHQNITNQPRQRKQQVRAVVETPPVAVDPTQVSRDPVVTVAPIPLSKSGYGYSA